VAVKAFDMFNGGQGTMALGYVAGVILGWIIGELWIKGLKPSK
jgi:hypothetical protein